MRILLLRNFLDARILRYRNTEARMSIGDLVALAIIGMAGLLGVSPALALLVWP